MLRDLLMSLHEQVWLDEALCLLLQVHRDEQLQATVMSALPLWELAKQLVENGANARKAVNLGIIDRHALALSSARGSTEAQRDSIAGVRFGREMGLVLHDHTRLIYSDLPLALRDFEEWQARRLVEPSPIVAGAGARMHPGELDDYLEDVRRVAMPLADCKEAAVRLDIPEIWASASRRQLIIVMDKLRSGGLPVWTRADREGLGQFYVGSEVVRRLDQRIPGPRRTRSTPQQSLGF